MSDTLSTQWKEMSLAQLLGPDSLFCDGDWVESRDQDAEGENRLIQLADIGDGRFLDKSDRFMNDGQFARLRCTALNEGDILIARMPDPIGRACLFPAMNMRCATVVDVAILRKAKAHPKWLVAAINSDLFRRRIEINSCGTTRTRISRGFLSALKLLVPPLATQKNIAVVLDCIDTAIEKTEALIAKYQQIKTGLMHDLFTRGVLPNGQLRPTREQAPELYQETAIGWIPREWRFTTCSTVCEQIIDCKNRTPPETPAGYPVIRTPNVRNGEFVDHNLVFTDEHSYSVWTMRGKPRVGDIVITREAPVGEVCRIPERHPSVCLGQRMMLYRPNQQLISPQYFLYALQSRQIQNRLDLISGGSTVGHVRVGDIRDLWIFMPESPIEQNQIASTLDGVSEKLSGERRQLDKLRQQKTGLMQDLLTGKVQVKVDAPEPAHA